MTIPEAAVEAAEYVSHWLVNRGAGWGCDGCDWTSAKIEDFWKTHGRPVNDNTPF